MSFNPLFQLDRETEEKARFLQSQIDEKYISLGVVSKEEVTQSRYGHGRYNYDTILDESLGERLSSAEAAPIGGSGGSAGSAIQENFQGNSSEN